MLPQSLVLLAASLNLASCGPIRRQDATRHFRLARSYNQTLSSIEITTPPSSTFPVVSSTANVPSQILTPVLTPGTSTSTTSILTPTSFSNPAGQVGQVPAFANDPGASTIANDASATLFSRSFTLGTGIAGVSSAMSTSAVHQGVSSGGPTTSIVVIGSSSSSQTPSTTKSLNTNPVSFSIQTSISSTLSTPTSSMVSVTPTTGAILPTHSPVITGSPGSSNVFSTSIALVLTNTAPNASSTIPQTNPAATVTQTLGVSTTVATTTIPSGTFSVIATSIVATSSIVPSAATNITAPNSQNSNLVMALAYNAIFDTLTADSDCSAADSSRAVACISGRFAQCGSDGKFTLATCPQGQQCFALPLPGGESGVSVQCDSSEDGASKLGLAAPETTGVVSTTAMSPTALLSPLTFSTSSTTIIPQTSTSAQSSMATLTTLAPSASAAVIVSQVSTTAQSTTADLTHASSASPTVIAPQVVTATSNDISLTTVASLPNTVETSTTPDRLPSITTVLVQPSYTTSTSIGSKATSVSVAAESSPFDSQLPPTSTDVPSLSMATSEPTSSQAAHSPVQALTPTSNLVLPASPSTSTTVVLITTPSPGATQASTFHTVVSPTTAQSSSTPIVPTPAFTIVPVKNNATPTVTETITETVTIAATVTVRG